MITFRYFPSVDLFKIYNSSYKGYHVLPATEADLYRGAITVGMPYQYRPTAYFPTEVLEWKLNTIKTFVDTQKPPFEIKNISFFESSERTGIAFFLGMIFAHVFAQLKLGIIFTEHLNNASILPKLRPNNRMHPDLWGLASNGTSYLIEAKGSLTPDNLMKSKVIKDAKKQLENVLSIEYTDSGNRSVIYKSKQSLKRIAVAMFPYQSKKSNPLAKTYPIHLNVVDPEPSGGEVVKINGDEMVLKYYQFLINMLSQEKAEEQKLKGINYIIYKVPNHNLKLGLVKDVYDLVEPYVKKYEEHKEKNKIIESDFFEGSLLYQKLTDNDGILHSLQERYREQPIDVETHTIFSIGIDGVLVIKE